jgi:serine/threonine protein kinase
MRNSHSLLINKYYEPSNQPNIFSKDLLMEFLPFPTLTEFAILNRHSVSLTTKIHFIFLIVQALRSLAKYKIAHMDLKPNNILTYYFNTIRLVDFG